MRKQCSRLGQDVKVMAQLEPHLPALFKQYVEARAGHGHHHPHKEASQSQAQVVCSVRSKLWLMSRSADQRNSLEASAP